METKKKIKRPNSKDTNYENEQSCENKSLVAPCVIGHIDYGFGFYFPDLGLAMPEPPIFQSRALFVIDNCPAPALERLWDASNWNLVDNLNDECILVQKKDTHLLYISNGNKPCIVSNTENTPCPVGMWMHGCTPLDQQYIKHYYEEIQRDILPTNHHREHSAIYLVLCVFPLKLMKLAWPAVVSS